MQINRSQSFDYKLLPSLLVTAEWQSSPSPPAQSPGCGLQWPPWPPAGGGRPPGPGPRLCRTDPPSLSSPPGLVCPLTARCRPPSWWRTAPASCTIRGITSGKMWKICRSPGGHTPSLSYRISGGSVTNKKCPQLISLSINYCQSRKK